MNYARSVYKHIKQKKTKNNIVKQDEFAYRIDTTLQ